MSSEKTLSSIVGFGRELELAVATRIYKINVEEGRFATFSDFAGIEGMNNGTQKTVLNYLRKFGLVNSVDGRYHNGGKCGLVFKKSTTSSMGYEVYPAYHKYFQMSSKGSYKTGI